MGVSAHSEGVSPLGMDRSCSLDGLSVISAGVFSPAVICLGALVRCFRKCNRRFSSGHEPFVSPG